MHLIKDEYRHTSDKLSLESASILTWIKFSMILFPVNTIDTHDVQRGNSTIYMQRYKHYKYFEPFNNRHVNITQN